MFFMLVAGFGLMCVLNIAITLEYIGHRRYLYRKDVEELADVPYACRLLAEALEIEAPGENVAEYVSWAIKECIARKRASKEASRG